MLECPRCGNEAEYVAGEVFVLVWCDFCADLIEVGDLHLHTTPPTVAKSTPTVPLSERASRGNLAAAATR